MPRKRTRNVSRRHFVKSATVAAAATSAMPRFVVGAPADRPLKIGLVGCGGRGTGAAENALDADKHVTITAMADIAEDRMNHSKKKIEDKQGTSISDSQCFLGLDAYKKLLDTDVDYVILATPPYYRPEHFPACIAADKHVFMEKPVAVDPVGARKIMDAGAEAKQKKLMVAAGTQRRHQNGYIETIRRIREGAIGNVIAGQCYWCMGALWSRPRQEGWDDMEWMHRDWVNWAWLSGDHICEQHVHNIDIINWTLGSHPLKAVAMGGRAHRPTGDQFDYFSAEFTYPNEVHVQSMCRQVPDCWNSVSERVLGQDGWSNCNGHLSNFGKVPFRHNDPYVQEHVDLIAAIRTGEELNEARNVAESTLSAIMARTSAYTGKEVTWSEMMESNLELRPPAYELTEANIKAHVPVPGKPW